MMDRRNLCFPKNANHQVKVTPNSYLAVGYEQNPGAWILTVVVTVATVTMSCELPSMPDATKNEELPGVLTLRAFAAGVLAL